MERVIKKILSKLKKNNQKFDKIKISIKQKENNSIIKIKSGFKIKKIKINEEKIKGFSKLTLKEIEKLIERKIPKTLENQPIPPIKLIGLAIECVLNPHLMQELK